MMALLIIQEKIEKFSNNKKIKIIYQKNKGLVISNNIAIKQLKVNILQD